MITVVLAVFSSGGITSFAAGYECPAAEHRDKIIEYEAATETENGRVTYRCEVCGRVYVNILLSTDHVWGDWVTEKEPTCTQDGLRRRTCVKHGTNSQTEVIPATGHKYTKRFIPASCTDDGFSVYTCSLCGASYSEFAGAAAGHNYVVTETIEPDCKKAGSKTFECDVCGDTYTEEFGEPSGHRYQSKVIKAPGCEEPGETSFTCTDCGHSYLVSEPAIGRHEFGGWTVETAPAAGVQGLRYMECLQCGLRREEPIAALAKKAAFNEVDAALGSVSFSSLIVFSLLIYSDLCLVFWDRARKKKYREKRFMEKRETENYDFN